MNSRREFDIAFVGLKPGIHEFQYQISDRFFEAYQQQDFKHCNAQVKLLLDKMNGFMLLRFEIGGKLEVSCDRCGNNLPLDLWEDFNLLVKLVENPDSMNQEEEDPDVYYISRNDSILNVADWVYEFVNLSIPFQRMCKNDEIGGPHCNKEVLAMLNKLDENAGTPQNSLWKGLEKFRNPK